MRCRMMIFSVHGSLRPWLQVVGLLACLLLTPPAVASAQAASSAETGCSCHSAETEVWQQSPHGQTVRGDSGLPAATCEDCHGPYLRGHPDAGVMTLTVDSDVCHTCHTGTFDQWQKSVHAQADVRCTGCHLSHSQALRLSDETLCLSCHRDATGDNFHLSHLFGEVACTDCHLASPDSPTAESAVGGETVVTIPAPNHDFVSVSSDMCVDCHRQNIGDERVATSLAASEMTPVNLVALAGRVPALTAKLKSAETENRSLAVTSVIALALGLGVGGVLGMIFVLAVGCITQRRAKS